MSAFAIDAAWLRELRIHADAPPRRPRQPLWAGDSLIGSVEADFISQIDPLPSADLYEMLSKEERLGITGWAVRGELTASLNFIAIALRQAGLAGTWRDEQLAVHDERGTRLGTIERAAVRPLGITTRAVHLAGLAPDGRHWLQQRAFNKAVDPGLWDTLMGGMISAADTLESALQRETWEEAGLQVSALQQLRHGGQFTIRRPSKDAGGAGYVIEHIDWFDCTVPGALQPVNQDGEVVSFELLSIEAVWARMQSGDVTTEAALVIAEMLAT